MRSEPEPQSVPCPGLRAGPQLSPREGGKVQVAQGWRKSEGWQEGSSEMEMETGLKKW